MTELIQNAKIAFASVTKPEGHKNGKHLLGVYVDKKFKKNFETKFNELWEEEKTNKAKNPVYASKEWFSEDDKGNLVFWINKDAKSEFKIKFKQAEGCNFKYKDFGMIGEGSIADVSYDLYYYNHKDFGEMILRSIKAIKLIELVPYSDDGGVGGDEISEDDDYYEAPAPKGSDEDQVDEEPKKKKKKKKKKKSE